MRKDNRGFTLIEVIIAMSIFVIVIGIGYSVMNKTNDSINRQHITTKSQMDVNIVNRYLTKDLEQATDKTYSPIYTEKGYKYVINTNNGEVLYNVVLSKNNTYYDLIRETSKDKISIVENQRIESSTPFIITRNSVNSNIYEVSLDYDENKKQKQYKFNISPRFVATYDEGDIKPPIVEPPPPPEIDLSKGLGYIEFWSTGNTNNNSNSIFTSTTSKTTGNVFPSEVKPTSSNIHKISVKADPFANNGKVDANIDNISNVIQNNGQFPGTNGNGDVIVSIYASEGAKLSNISIEGHSNVNLDKNKVENGEEPLQVKFSVTSSFLINADFERTSNYGYIIIQYGFPYKR